MKLDIEILHNMRNPMMTIKDTLHEWNHDVYDNTLQHHEKYGEHHIWANGTIDSRMGTFYTCPPDVLRLKDGNERDI